MLISSDVLGPGVGDLVEGAAGGVGKVREDAVPREAGLLSAYGMCIRIWYVCTGI